MHLLDFSDRLLTEFQEVRIAPAQHLWASLAETGLLRDHPVSWACNRPIASATTHSMVA
jgi:hypothetical protein